MTFSALQGLTLKEVQVTDDEVHFLTEDREFRLYHSQDCCESVHVEDVIGDIADLIGTPIIVAEEVSSEEHPEGITKESESFTWTFYKLRTIKGSVTIRFYGQSNGYYSESVNFDSRILQCITL